MLFLKKVQKAQQNGHQFYELLTINFMNLVLDNEGRWYSFRGYFS